MKLADVWEWRLAAPMYDLPALLASICDDEWTFEDEVNPDELGACAVHMEWQESFSMDHVLISSDTWPAR